MKRLVTLLGFLAVLPFFVSRRARVCKSIWIDVPPAGVFPFINTLKNWPLWTEWSRQNEKMEVRYEGPESGDGATQHWSSCCTRGTTRLLASLPDQRITYSVEMQDGRYEIDGMFSLEPESSGTRVTWAAWWLGAENPYARYGDLAMRLFIGRDFAAGLENLKELVETPHKTEAA